MNFFKRLWQHIEGFLNVLIPQVWSICLIGIITMVVLVVLTALVKFFLLMLGVA